MKRFVHIEGSVLDADLDDGTVPDQLLEYLEAALSRMKANPGGENEEVTLVLSNDFKDEDDETETEKE